MPAVLMPYETSKRLRQRIDALSKLTELKLMPAKGGRHFILFTEEDLALFDGETGEPYILAVRDLDILKAEIPQREGSRANYIPVRNKKAAQLIDPFWTSRPPLHS